ncbi:hypothetical protein ACP8WK_34025 [Mycolicibacterium nivoides]|uniref:hypothetical protein n=1 Tax=Mycolicibacterium nivoides TaxID=2487344 RepID=UPI003CF494B0
MHQSDTFVVDDSELPVVFSVSPDSPAAPFLVEHHPRRLEDMYEIGAIAPIIPIEHLKEIEQMVRTISMPKVVASSGLGVPVAPRKLARVLTTPPEVMLVREVARRGAAVLEARGFDSELAQLTAAKAASFITPGPKPKDLVWREVRMVDRDLDIHGRLVVDRKINALSARNIHFGVGGWLVPAASHFILKCDLIYGDPMPKVDVARIVQEITEMGVPRPPEPVETWTQRQPINEIHAAAQRVTQNWR